MRNNTISFFSCEKLKNMDWLVMVVVYYVKQNMIKAK